MTMMATFAANIGFKISHQFPSRVFSTARIFWRFQIACLKSREFSSSVPARYIPKSPETALPVKSLESSSFPDVSVPKINGGSEANSTIAHYGTSRNPDEVHTDLLFDDNQEGSEQMEEVGELTIHLAGDACEKDLIQTDKFTNDVEQSAIKLLAVRALTAVELRKKLLGKRFSPNAVEAVISKLQRKGFINDRLYAESFSQSRWSSSSWGPRRIKQSRCQAKEEMILISICDLRSSIDAQSAALVLKLRLSRDSQEWEP
ncbi:uncharacterized protein LOC130732963 isoform X3 [Lotus japonicus]|uniref:uncharacterized protein LOC130732963 isoform X3 n=1 Tax=Lotus japonicus TaxID=34305 RepID=UPI002589AA80|nr:uncharacterized protein LOC130732963 isoform X3 [Lotus japonicus]